MAETRSDMDSMPLGEEDLCDIVKELTCVAARWRNIGILLGIRASDLDAIRGDRPIDCLLAMLLIWLRKSYNVKRFGEPTWLKLVEVVSNKAGGENTSLAEDIARRYKCTLSKEPQVKQHAEAIPNLCTPVLRDKRELLINQGRDQVLEPNTEVDKIGGQEFEVKQPKVQNLLQARDVGSKAQVGVMHCASTASVLELSAPRQQESKQLKESEQQEERIEELERDLAHLQMKYEKLLERKGDTLMEQRANQGKEAEILALKRERVQLTEALHRVQEHYQERKGDTLMEQRANQGKQAEISALKRERVPLTEELHRLQEHYQERKGDTLMEQRANQGKEAELLALKRERVMLTEELHRVQEERGKLEIINLQLLQRQQVRKVNVKQNFEQSEDSVLLLLQDRITKLNANFVQVYQDCNMRQGTKEPSRSSRLVKELDAYLSTLERLQVTVGSLACRCPLCSILFYSGTALDISRFRNHMHNHLSKNERTDHRTVQKEAERVCPVCKTNFPVHVRQEDFEHHVSAHFAD